MEHRVETPDGRIVGVAEFGDPAGDVVLWCHGGPGSRLEPMWLDGAARDAGLRIVGVDRPGYGWSTPRPGRTIVDAVDDLARVADASGASTFATVGCSTGGAYALAAAARFPERVWGVVACAAMTDMAWVPGRATMSRAHALAVWDAPDRCAAIAAAVASHGEHGEKLFDGSLAGAVCPADRAMFANPEWMEATRRAAPQMFTYGLEGYADDRIADGGGWTGFDVARILCPVVVLHGTADIMVSVIHAEHTAALVPGPELVLVDGGGHFSVESDIVRHLLRLRP